MTSLEWIVIVGFGVMYLIIHILGGHLLHIAKQLDGITRILDRIQSDVAIARLDSKFQKQD